jgi:hypothetical protein
MGQCTVWTLDPAAVIRMRVCGKKADAPRPACPPPPFPLGIVSRGSADMEVAWEWAALHIREVLLQGPALNRMSTLL